MGSVRHSTTCLSYKETGFSLVELMTVLTIASILAGIAVPSFQQMLQRQRVATTATDFLFAINLTRVEAIQRGGRVDMMAVNGEWKKGWVVFVDLNANHKYDDGDTAIHVQEGAPDGMEITSTLTDSTAPYVAFNGTGRSQTNASSYAPQWGSFRFSLGTHERKIILNMIGRPRLCDPTSPKIAC